MQVRHPLALSWLILSGAYLLLLVSPFAFVGHDWLTLWMLLSLPLSAVAERWIGIGSDSHMLIAGVSIVQAALVGTCLVFPAGALLHELRRDHRG
jgi:hypothetical protein